MSKTSPLKGPHEFLVKGAYDAAGNQVYQHYIQKTHERLMQIGNEASQWDFGTGARRILNSKGRLPQSEIDNVRKILSGPRKEEYDNYARNNDTAGMEKIKEEEIKHNQQLQQFGQMRMNLARAFANGELQNHFLHRSPQGKEIAEMMRDVDRLREKKCPPGVEDCENKGDWGLEIRDYKKIADVTSAMQKAQAELNNLQTLDEQGRLYSNEHLDRMGELQSEINGYNELLNAEPSMENGLLKWASIDEVSGMIKTIDVNSKNRLEAIRKSVYDRAFGSHPEDEITFRKDKVLESINNGVIASGDINSLVYDEMINGRIFYDDLVGHIKGANDGGKTYKDWGVTDDMMWNTGDVNQDGIISDEEAENIAQAVVNNEPVIKKELSEYMLQHVYSNHEEALAAKREKYGSNVTEEILDSEQKTDATELNPNHFEGSHFNFKEDVEETTEEDDDEEEDVGDFIETEDTLA